MPLKQLIFNILFQEYFVCTVEELQKDETVEELQKDEVMNESGF